MTAAMRATRLRRRERESHMNKKRATRLSLTSSLLSLFCTHAGGNVGAAARAMLNFGLFDLRLVDPTADPMSEEATLRASGARPLLERAVTHETVGAAVADLQLVLATTARPREEKIPVYAPREAIAAAAAAIRRGERVGFLFGSEKNGLSNDELEHASAIVTIPTAPGFSSLNLAQAVLLVCYEWGARPDADDETTTQYDVALAASMEDALAGDARAPLGQLDSLLDFWEGSLWHAGFFGGKRGVGSSYGEEAGAEQERERAKAVMRKLRRLVLRAEASKGEASLLRGALQAMVAQQEGKDSDSEVEE